MTRLSDRSCFSESDPNAPLVRRAGAEGIGTFLLVFAAVGAGIAAARLPGGGVAVSVLVIATVIPAALASLIIAFGEISGGHFNPLITGLQWLRGERSLGCTLAYVAAQCAFGVAGAIVASALLGLPASRAVEAPSLWRLGLSEVVASASLMTIVFACALARKKDSAPAAVGSWLFAAILATPSGSYANPAVAVAAVFATGPIALSTTQALAFVVAQLIGALLSLIPISVVFPPRARASAEPNWPQSLPASASGPSA